MKNLKKIRFSHIYIYIYVCADDCVDFFELSSLLAE